MSKIWLDKMKFKNGERKKKRKKKWKRRNRTENMFTFR